MQCIFVFDENNPNWVSNQEYNLFYLKMQANFLNDVLKVRGHLFVNDVLDALQIRRIPLGQQHGWIYADFPGSHLIIDLEPQDNGSIHIKFKTSGDPIWDRI